MIWARVIADELERYDSAQAALNESREQFERMQGIAMILVVAISQVETLERRLRQLVEADPQLERARKAFDQRVADIAALRNTVMHLDEYAVGRGRRQTGKIHPRVDMRNIFPSLTGVPKSANLQEGGRPVFFAMLDLGDERINLHVAGSAAIELARVVELVRERHLRNVERRLAELGGPIPRFDHLLE